MNKNTKTLLGVAVVAGLGYYLYTQYGKKSSAGFANFADIKGKCRCHTEVLNGVYLCGDGRSLALESGGPCPGANPAGGKQQRTM